MKKFVLVFLLFGMIGFNSTLFAQSCTITNFSVSVKSLTSTAAGCEMVVDIKFTGTFNNGNKYAFVHLWESAPVNKYPNLTYANPPTASQLSNALANIVIKDPGVNSASLNNQYPPNTGVPVVFTGVTFSKTGTGPYNFTLANVKLPLSSCEALVSIKGDAWASQSNDAQNVHCFNKNEVNYQFTNPVLTGLLRCTVPRQFNISVDNTKNSAASTVNYSVYVDGGTLGVRDAPNDVLVSGPSVLNVPANQSLTTPYINYSNAYSATTPWANRALLVDATATNGLQSITYTGILIENTCTILPVHFKSFTASRKGDNINLKWITATEQNNKGFHVQRSTGAEWKDVAFVFSQAENGNSTTELSYFLADLNPHKGVSQYRILQVDLDGKGIYSGIRSVRGNGAASKIVLFPNPSTTGAVTLLFDTEGAKQVVVSDIAGRIVQQQKNVMASSLDIKNLTSGFYTVQVTDVATGFIATEKFIIKKR